jgi:hypothetical protein
MFTQNVFLKSMKTGQKLQRAQVRIYLCFELATVDHSAKFSTTTY